MCKHESGVISEQKQSNAVYYWTWLIDGCCFCHFTLTSVHVHNHYLQTSGLQSTTIMAILYHFERINHRLIDLGPLISLIDLLRWKTVSLEINLLWWGQPSANPVILLFFVTFAMHGLYVMKQGILINWYVIIKSLSSFLLHIELKWVCVCIFFHFQEKSRGNPILRIKVIRNHSG